MHYQEFLRRLDEPRIIEAIRRAETHTTGEVRLCVTRTAESDPLAAARRAFVTLGMERTRDRNGVLILVSPASQTFAVLGDEGINGRCGELFWDQTVRDLASAFASGRVEDGLEAAILRVGEVLAAHFPRAPGDSNELPDNVATV
jgi:uncharacterized membrane protein